MKSKGSKPDVLATQPANQPVNQLLNQYSRVLYQFNGGGIVKIQHETNHTHQSFVNDGQHILKFKTKILFLKFACTCDNFNANEINSAS